MEVGKAFTDGILFEVRRRIHEEGMHRIKYCLDQLSDEDIWYRPNPSSNSVGNLVLHLCGNVRQWVVSGLTDKADTRNRDYEFEEKGPLPVAKLKTLLDSTWQEVNETLESLAPEDLLQTYNVQGFKETGISILIHVVEHFSYHVGQITYFVKYRKDLDTGYYADLDLNLKK